MKRIRHLRRSLILMLLLGVGAYFWVQARNEATISATPASTQRELVYTEKEKIFNAISLSYLTYGCETCEQLNGSVAELIQDNEMGILIENDGVIRTDKSDPNTALFDTSEFISEHVGNYRYLTCKKNKDNSFYGVAFADDSTKTVWISYAGSVDLKDALACMELVAGPKLSSQEQDAFAFYEEVLMLPEIAKENYQLVLTGHSLGGAFAAMISRMSGYPAITINGADGLAIDKANGILKEEPSEYNISNYLTDPKNGKISFMDIVQRCMFLGNDKAVDYHVYEESGLTEDPHCAFSFIIFRDKNFEKPEIPAPVMEAGDR